MPDAPKPMAARVGDTTGHGGQVTGPGVATVLIGGRPAAAVPDMHSCPLPYHVPTPFTMGSATVFIGGRSALRQRDSCGCGAPIVVGAPTVQIGD
jgi:uncharacterized Zn-binding protein involved in type VI secretion